MEGLGYGCRDQGLLFSINAHMWTTSIPILTFGSGFRGRPGYEAIVTRSFDDCDDALRYIVRAYGTAAATAGEDS